MNSTAEQTAAPKRDMRRQHAASQETFARRRIEKALAEIIDQGCTLRVGRDGWIQIVKAGEVVYRTGSLPIEAVAVASPY